MTSLVSFGALRAFVEVGRQGSIKRAAQVLNVTPGAVSQQVKALETRFGVQLLDRNNRQVQLSVHGLRLHDKVAPGFEQIDAAVELFEVGQPAARSLIVSTTPSFATCWLVPRLGSFTARHPQIDIKIETSVQFADVGAGAVDVAIRHGSGNYPGLETSLLFSPRLVAITKHSLLAHGPLNPADCLRYALLQDRDRADWPAWFEANGVKPTRAAKRGTCYADDALLIQAAIAGQGFAVVRDVYAASALNAGSVKLVMDWSVQTEADYFLVVKPERRAVPKIAAFRSWIMDIAKGIVTD
jgi:LysR family glycine cleavage system transcriptional activator